MNKQRREKLRNALSLINSAYMIIDDARSQEQDCLDNMPENLEYSDQYEKMESAVDNLDGAISSLDDVIDRISEAIV